MVQLAAVAQVVLRGAPFKRIVDAELPLPATKFAPRSASGKLCTAPAMALEGSSNSITGPLVSATVAEADFVGSAWLVAITEMAFGEGAAVGAV